MRTRNHAGDTTEDLGSSSEDVNLSNTTKNLEEHRIVRKRKIEREIEKMKGKVLRRKKGKGDTTEGRYGHTKSTQSLGGKKKHKHLSLHGQDFQGRRYFGP